MKIKSIQLCNFRQYKGNQKPIIFSTDDSENVTVILGVNTSGKTTIIQAFRWCLYGNCSFKTKSVLNVEVEDDMKPYESRDVSVEIVLIHEDREYTVRRSQVFRTTDSGKIKAEDCILKVQYKEDNGEQQGIPSFEAAKTINKILPEGLSDYFFFDGERIADINNRGDVVSSVRGLMGLDVISEIRDRLDPNSSKSVISKFLKELDTGSEGRCEKLSEKLTESQEKRKEISERLINVKSEIEYFEDRKNQLSQKLLDNEMAKKNQQQRNKLERDIENIYKIIIQAEDIIKRDFQRGALSYFALPLLEKARDVISKTNQVGEGIPEMRQPSIEYILKRNYCICGCDLKENQGARNRILHEKSLLPPAHIGTVLRVQEEKYKQFENDSKSYIKTLNNDYTNYRNNIKLLEEKQTELKDISKEISSSPSIDIARIESEYADNERTLKSKKDLRDDLNRQLGSFEKDIINIEKSIESLSITTEKNKRLKKYILYSKSLFDYFDSSYSKREKEVKEKLLESVNSIFCKMYPGKRAVSINDKYQIILSSKLNSSIKETDESKGLEAVKNFSFIAGLVDLARKKIIDSNSDIEDELDEELQIFTEPYPLVMDAPFSNTDEIHINNIAKIIPDIAEQVILIIMEKDWNFAKLALEKKVGGIYKIEKVNNNETNSIILGGNENV